MNPSRDETTADSARLNAESVLPVERAFVVQLHATAAVAQAQLSGRVEHVLSGKSVHFHGLDALLTFIARVLTGPETTPP